MYRNQIPLPRPQRVRSRRLRRPFLPSTTPGPYRLPPEMRDRLLTALQPFKNREAAYILAVFLARYWSAPTRIEKPFSVDRRALKDQGDLDLTEARVRGAIRVLEEIGFLDREEVGKGSRYRPTVDGLHRKPIEFRLGLEYRTAFEAANKRAAAARGGGSKGKQSIMPPETVRRFLEPAISPKYKTSVSPRIYLGEVKTKVPEAAPPNPKLEAALARLLQGIRQTEPLRVPESA
jgi:DNA-binding transcriptional ArsR family regulator